MISVLYFKMLSVAAKMKNQSVKLVKTEWFFDLGELGRRKQSEKV